MASCYPKLTVQLMQGISGTIVKGVKDGNLDAGCVLGLCEDQEFGVIRLKNVRLYVTAPAAWKEAVETACWYEIAELCLQ
jgi:hypothetical protein